MANPKAKPRKHDLKIGTDTYSITRINVMKSFALFPLFAPAIGRGLGRIAGALKDVGILKDDEKLTWATIAKLFDDDDALKALALEHAETLLSDLGNTLGMMKPEDVYRLQRELFASMTKNDVPMFPKEDDKRFEDEFGGDPWRVLKLFAFALQVNYMDFSLAVAPVAGSSQPAPDAAAVPSPDSTT